jgi:hypothetical protein
MFDFLGLVDNNLGVTPIHPPNTRMEKQSKSKATQSQARNAKQSKGTERKS